MKRVFLAPLLIMFLVSCNNVTDIPQATIIPQATNTVTLVPALTATAFETSTPTFVPTLTPISTPIKSTKSFETKMGFVPSGVFTMSGSEEVHDVYLDDYYMDIYEVTNVDYRVCVESGGCELPNNTDKYDNKIYAKHPVIYVDWYKAKAYCVWRGARLPTDAEWEKSARGNDQRTYPWGNTFDGTKLNFCDKNCTNGWAAQNVDDGYVETSPVGTYKSGISPYGMYDMSGNVWEWTNDWYDKDYYKHSSRANPLGADFGTGRISGGGSWNDNGVFLLLTTRMIFTPDYSSYYLGFRCARTP